MTTQPSFTPADRPATRPELLISALSYAVAGWPVLPLHTPGARGSCSCRRDVCSSPGKHPRTRHGLHDATTDIDTIRAWWARWPNANIAVRTGTIIVIDIDGLTGMQALAELEAAHGALPATRAALSGRGQHLYFHAGQHQLANSAGRLGRGLDIRAHGGYITAPPSQHATGHYYTWLTTAELAILPDWLVAWLSQASPPPPRVAAPITRHVGGERARRYMHAALEAELGELARAVKDTRNDTLNRVAFRLGQLVGAGIGDRDRVTAALLDQALDIGLGDREARATIASGLNAGERSPRQIAASAYRWTPS